MPLLAFAIGSISPSPSMSWLPAVHIDLPLLDGLVVLQGSVIILGVNLMRAWTWR